MPLGSCSLLDGDDVLMAQKDDWFPRKVSALPGKQQVVGTDNFVIEFGAELRERFFKVGVERHESLWSNLALFRCALRAPGNRAVRDGTCGVASDFLGINPFRRMRQRTNLLRGNQERPGQHHNDQRQQS